MFIIDVIYGVLIAICIALHVWIQTKGRGRTKTEGVKSPRSSKTFIY